MRTIKQIHQAKLVNMGGIFINQPLPTQQVEQIDPFLLVHHWYNKFKGGERQQNVGVGPHPHRGFSPVTFIFKGGVHHRDSLGNDSIINSGGTQWMDSGSGIIHSERPTKELAENGGEFEIIQFWVNLPKKHKMDNANYIPLSKNETPTITSNDGKVEVAVVCGDLEGVDGPIISNWPILSLRLNVRENGQIRLPVQQSFNTFLYLLDGELLINDEKKAKAKELVWFNNDSNFITIKGLENTRSILLAAEPINEPIQAHGPFVMNTRNEIIQALNDYNSGKMGYLKENFNN